MVLHLYGHMSISFIVVSKKAFYDIYVKLLKYYNSSNELKVLPENIVLISVTLLASLIEILPSLS
jgi:hypothetical protein